MLQRRQLILSPVSVLIGTIGRFNNIRHLLPLVMQLLLQFLINVIKNHALSPEIINLLPQLLVIRNRLIKFLISLIQTVL